MQSQPHSRTERGGTERRGTERGGHALDLAILGLLKDQALHGYELKKRLSETLGLLASVSFGSLYPALARLEAAGTVAEVNGTPAGAGGTLSPAGPASPSIPMTGSPPIPMTGSLSGERAAFRALLAGRRMGRPALAGPDHASEPGRRPLRQRKVYAITEMGLARFEQMLAGGDAAIEDDRGFDLRLALARHLAPEARLRLLERRRAVLAQRQAQDRSPTGTDSCMTGADSYTMALAEHRAEGLAADITWLDRLIAAERGDLAGSSLPGGHARQPPSSTKRKAATP